MGLTDDEVKIIWTVLLMILDEGKTLSGEIEFAKEAAEPFGRHHELKQYRDAFKDSVALLASYTSEKMSGNIVPGDFVGEDQWIPSGIIPHKFEVIESDTIDVEAGSFDAVILQSKINPQNKLWIVDEFPFPIKAEFYLDRICDSGCPFEYRFELLNYSKNTKYGSFIEMASQAHSENLSPLKQFKSGVPIDEIQCKKGLVQVFKKSNSFPSCIKPETVSELKKRDWAKSQFSFCGADGFDSKGNMNKNNSTHIWDENSCKWTKNVIQKNGQVKYSETVTDNNPYNNELIIFQKDNFGSLQYDKTKHIIDETFLSKTVGEWQKVSWDILMEEHEKYLPEHKFFDHLGSFLIKNEFQNIMNELGIVNVEDDFEVKSGMSLTSLPPHNSYYSIIKATDGNYYRLQGGTHANEVNVSKVSALLFFDTSVDFKMEDLVSKNQLFTILPENNNEPEIEPFNLIIHTNNSKVEFYNNTPEIIRIQDSGTGRVGEEHLFDWVGPTILPYTTASMTFDEPGNFDFDARFAPNLENPLWWSTHTGGTIIVMSDDMSSVSREEKNKMAQSLLFDLGLPVVGQGQVMQTMC